MVLLCRGAENVRTRERGSGEILINLKTENKWKFQLTGKHQNKQIETWKEKIKHGKEKQKRKENAYRREGENFILPVGGKRKF